MTGEQPTKKTALGTTGAGQELLAGLERQYARLASVPLAPGLYIVSTPIGNLADITLRALHMLCAADAVYCEDTRHSRKLLAAYGIHRKLAAYHDFSGENERSRIHAQLSAGKSVALISDAGTPLISDPGFKLVRDVRASGIAVYAVPGPSALLAASVVSGLPADCFFFAGFLSPKEKTRSEDLRKLRAVPGTLILYEGGSRLAGLLDAIAMAFPARTVAVARELTKLHESVLTGSAREVAEIMRESQPPGEFVILIGPGEETPPQRDDIEGALLDAMKRMSLKDAVEEVAEGLGIGRKTVYNLALKLRESGT